MNRLSDLFYSRMYTLGALWNLGIGFIGIVFYDFSITLFFGPGTVADNLVSALFFRLFCTAVAVFGVGYYMVSRDLTSNRGIVWLGMASKILLFVIFTALFIAGEVTFLAFLALCGDMAWALLFILFLWQTREGAGAVS